MWKVLQVLIIAVFVNCSYYSFTPAFLPSGPNTKMVLALLGMAWFLFDSWRKGLGIPLSRGMFGGVIFAIAYSLVNLISVELNDTVDYSYANYVTTFFVWVFSVYPALAMIRLVHGSLTIPRITYYLAGLGVFQCVMALLIDNFPAVDEFCNRIVYWDLEFFDEIDRLRCFSAALDPAGVRFALTLILIAAVICVDKEIQQSSRKIYLLFLAYILISGIGNMVSRTTTTGMSMGVVLLLVYSNTVSLKVRAGMVRTMSIFATLLVIGFAVGAFLYNTSPYFREQLTFAFEGFFNLVNNGTFETGSTNLLQETITWPTDDRTWLIGKGIYSGYAANSDAGYSRFIFYSGLIGFSVFALSFVFYAFYFARKYPPYRWLFLAYLAMTFIVWIKVSTDILMIYAFFFWFSYEESNAINGLTPIDEDA